MGSLVGPDEIGEHVLDVSARAGLIPQQVLHVAHHPLANPLIAPLPPHRRQRAKPLRHLESKLKVTDPEVKDKQAPERAQLVLGIIKALRDFECLRPERAQFTNNDLSNCAGKTPKVRLAKRGAKLISRRGSPPSPILHAASACSARLWHSSSSD